MTRGSVLGGLALAALAAGCGGGPPPPSDRPLVAVTILPHVELVDRIGGGLFRTTAVVSPGESPETFLPADADVSRLLGAAALLKAGVPSERGRWLQTLREGGVKLFDLTQGLELLAMDEAHGDHVHQGPDPHTWLAPGPLETIGRNVAAALTELIPAEAARFAANLAAWEAELDRLDRDLAAILAPCRGKRFYVFHPAWGYLAHAYGLEQVAVEVAGKEPSDHELTVLQERARADGTRVLFVQPQARSRTAQAVAAALGARLETLDPLAPDLLANLRQAAAAIAAACP